MVFCSLLWPEKTEKPKQKNKKPENQQQCDLGIFPGQFMLFQFLYGFHSIDTE